MRQVEPSWAVVGFLAKAVSRKEFKSSPDRNIGKEAGQRVAGYRAWIQP
ncbi:MAG: hypothetical protein Q8S14_12465 [Algoriphagus sp.]|nr:hypothetical protein [Algoriphagus sp.]MDP3472677.1 hypothetical protein [Algoriphagus sp.]